MAIQTLSTRDKQAIQNVTRYPLTGYARKYEFSIVNGSRVLIEYPGTTSRAYFRLDSDSLSDLEMYLAKIAVFAIKRLIKKHGTQAKHLVGRDVLVFHQDMRCTMHLWELIADNTGETVDTLFSGTN